MIQAQEQVHDETQTLSVQSEKMTKRVYYLVNFYEMIWSVSIMMFAILYVRYFEKSLANNILFSLAFYIGAIEAISGPSLIRSYVDFNDKLDTFIYSFQIKILISGLLPLILFLQGAYSPSSIETNIVISISLSIFFSTLYLVRVISYNNKEEVALLATYSVENE